MNGVESAFFATATRIVDDAFPVWVAVEFRDVNGVAHTLIDKAPVFGVDERKLSAPVLVECEILGREGTEGVRISTAKPLGIETDDGLHEFTISCSSLPDSQS